jgi:hypothetical protein
MPQWTDFVRDSRDMAEIWRMQPPQIHRFSTEFGAKLLQS